MTEAAAEPAEALDALRRPMAVHDDVIRLRGRPGDLAGVLSVTRAPEPIGQFRAATRNFHETRVGYLHRLNHAQMLTSSAPVDQDVPRHLVFSNRLAPGSSGKVPVRFSLPDTTPPGRYRAVFDVAGEPREAEIEVLPDERAEIRPGSITIAGAPGDIVTQELLLVNHGNVPIVIDVLGMLVLQEENQTCLGLQEAMAMVQGMEGTEGAHRVFLDTLASSIAARRTDFARVRAERGPVILAAGDAEMVPVAFHLPTNMRGGRRYDAELQFGAASLQVRILALGTGAKRQGRRGGILTD